MQNIRYEPTCVYLDVSISLYISLLDICVNMLILIMYMYTFTQTQTYANL